MITLNNEIYEQPAYGTAEAAVYLRIPYQTLRYWLTGFKTRPPIIHPVETDPVRLSFMNLLECHALAGMRKVYDLKLPKVRRALEEGEQRLSATPPTRKRSFYDRPE